MTEAEWSASDDLWQLLPFAAAQGNARKLLLFEVACCRRVWHLMDDDCHRGAVAAAERFADGDASAAALESAMKPVIRLWAKLPPASAFRWKPWHFLTGATRHLGSTGVYAASYAARAVAGLTIAGVANAVAPESAEVAAQVRVLRDIFGNPFYPVSLSPEWRTGTVLALARTMYEAREFSAMPILADALQDAGCDNPDILDHCRGPGPHVRGCWVVDLVLGKD